MRIQGFAANHGGEALRCENSATSLALIRSLKRPLHGCHQLRTVLLRLSKYSGHKKQILKNPKLQMTEKMNNAAGTAYPGAANKDSRLNRRLITFSLENSLYK